MTLLPGDVLAWKATPDAPLIDRLIGWGEHHLKQVTSDGFNYYHVAVVSPNTTKMYSAQPPKIDLYPIPLPLPPYVEVYRIEVPLTMNQLDGMFTYAEKRRGNIYDFLGCLTGSFIEIDGLEFCSKYTNDIYSWGDMVLVPAQLLISPNAVVSSNLLKRVV